MPTSPSLCGHDDDRARERRARRLARRQGLQLRRSRARDPRAAEYGLFHIVDPQMNTIVAGATPFAYSMDLDAVETWLASDAT